MRMFFMSGIVLTMVTSSAAAAQENPWTWRSALASGKVIEIRGVNGTITATPTGGTEVEVIARKSARRGDTASVTLEVIEHAKGVMICAVYEGSGPCGPGTANRYISNEGTDVRVDFEVRVPRDVRFSGTTVNGDIDATGLVANVYAGSVTGDIRISTAGVAAASNVSGSINARMGRADWNDELAFSTVSGPITLEIAGDLNANIRFRAVSGRLDSEWPITSRGGSSRSLAGVIGTGGRELHISTVSGAVNLRRAE